MDERPRRVLLACHAAAPWPGVATLLAERGYEVVTTREIAATAAELDRASLDPERGRFSLVLLQPLAAGAAGSELDLVLAARDDEFGHALLLVLEEAAGAAPLLARLAACDDWVAGGSEAELEQRVLLSLLRRDMLARHAAETVTDYKTGLPNDRYFYRRLVEEVERTRRHRLALALLLIDVDDFKQVNDRFSYSDGNYVLGTIGRKLRASSRSIDLPARIGGDEFALLLPSTALDEATHVAHRVSQVVGRCSFLAKDRGRDRDFTVSVSIGADAIHGEDGVTAEELLKRANVALQYAKKRGKKQTVFFAEVADRWLKEGSLLDEPRMAGVERSGSPEEEGAEPR